MKYKVNFKGMSTKEKIEYIWEYYKFHILAGIILINVVVSMIGSIINHKEPILNVIMINSNVSMQEEKERGFNSFFQEYGYEVYDGIVEISGDLHYYDDENTIYEDYQTYEILLALLSTGDYQLFFGTGNICSELNRLGVFDEFYEIYPEDNNWIVENGYYDETFYFGILKQKEQSEIVKEFAEFVLSP